MRSPASNPLPFANEHFVQLYHSDPELTDTAATYAADVLKFDGHAMLFFATRRHAELIRRALLLRQVDVGGAIAAGRLGFIHVETVLPKILRNGAIDEPSFQHLVGDLFATVRAKSRFRHLHVFGEIVNVLWRSGYQKATVDLEQLWNELLAKQSFTLYCAYQASHSVEDAAASLSEPLGLHTARMEQVLHPHAHPRRVFFDLPREGGPLQPLPMPSSN